VPSSSRAAAALAIMNCSLMEITGHTEGCASRRKLRSRARSRSEEWRNSSSSISEAISIAIASSSRLASDARQAMSITPSIWWVIG
jgi:hypothetical protein